MKVFTNILQEVLSSDSTACDLCGHRDNNAHLFISCEKSFGYESVSFGDTLPPYYAFKDPSSYACNALLRALYPFHS